MSGMGTHLPLDTPDYQGGGGARVVAPSPWVERWAACVASSDRVLDLACGGGRHALLFAARGCKVTAVDRDPTFVEAFANTSVRFVAADLENSAWPLSDARYDAIVVTQYLHRPLFPMMRSALAEGGLLIYETFAAGNAAFGRPTNPDFLLNPRELLDEFGDMRVIAFEDGFTAQPKPAMVQRIVVRNTVPRSVLPSHPCTL